MRRRGYSSVILWIFVLGLLSAIGFLWLDDLRAFITGQDIIDDLAIDVALFPTRTPYPTPTNEASPTQPGDVVPVVEHTPIPYWQHVLKYTVQPGDALFIIAGKFGLQPNTIFWANTDTLQDNVHLLHVGTQLYILPVDGVYHFSDGTQSFREIASIYDVTPQDILSSEYNNLGKYSVSDIPPAGLRIIVPGGSREFVSWRAPIRTGSSSGGANPEGSLHPGSCTSSYIGSGGLGNYMDPLGNATYYVTNEFAGYHAGIDLAGDEGLPIYAAETGVVVFAGWHLTGYGELVIIDHGDGWTTYYAHLLERLVSCGDQVSKGQMVGTMGTTGNSTGIHLHFEVRWKDVPQDPRLYIEVSGRSVP